MISPQSSDPLYHLISCNLKIQFQMATVLDLFNFCFFNWDMVGK